MPSERSAAALVAMKTSAVVGRDETRPRLAIRTLAVAVWPAWTTDGERLSASTVMAGTATSNPVARRLLVSVLSV